MADKTITQLGELAAGDLQTDDVLPIVNIHDTTQSPQGTTRKITLLSLLTNAVITGVLRFATAISQVVPGATSFSIRNNANSADNLLIADAGDVTVRAKLKMATAASQIVPGATSLSLRNNADNASNVAILDNGNMTVRGKVNIDDVTDATNATDGSLQTDGGLSVAKKAFIGDALRCGEFFPRSGGWVVRNDADTQDNFRVFDSGGDIEARGGFSGLRCTLSGHTTFGQLVLSAMSPAPVGPVNGSVWFDGSNLIVRIGGSNYTLDKTVVP